MSKRQTATADYFPHFASSGKTMFIIESKFGNDGYAAWFKILELLASSENHYYDCRNADNWEFLLAKTRLSGSNVDIMLNQLANLNAINPEFWKIRVIRSDNLIANLSALYRRRRVDVISNADLMSLLSTDNRVNESDVCNNPQSKVKESKVKESKVDEESIINDNDNDDTTQQHHQQPGLYNSLLKVLGKIVISPKEFSIAEKLIESGCTLEDIEQARIDKGKNNLAYLQNIVCEKRDQRQRKVFLDDIPV